MFGTLSPPAPCSPLFVKALRVRSVVVMGGVWCLCCLGCSVGVVEPVAVALVLPGARLGFAICGCFPDAHGRSYFFDEGGLEFLPCLSVQRFAGQVLPRDCCDLTLCVQSTAKSACASCAVCWRLSLFVSPKG